MSVMKTHSIPPLKIEVTFPTSIEINFPLLSISNPPYKTTLVIIQLKMPRNEPISRLKNIDTLFTLAQNKLNFC